MQLGSNVGSGSRWVRRVVGLLALSVILSSLGGCGRFGVELLSLADAGNGGSFDAGSDSGTAYGGDCDGSMCVSVLPMRCDELDSEQPQGLCGCGQSDTADADADGVPDCIDFCPGMADIRDDATCACETAAMDEDGDGVPNCADRCPFDETKQQPGLCGCGVADVDADEDGVPNCLDDCDDNPSKSVLGVCGCSVSDQDTDLDGMPDCEDRCSGVDDEAYVSEGCGVGYCLDTSVASSCVGGVETLCVPGQRLSDSDVTCDGIDDDCNGAVDDGYQSISHDCGLGVCRRSGTLICRDGAVVDTCAPGAPLNSDGLDTSCDGVDDDCDGLFDEDVASEPSACSVGACASSGVIACVDGALVDSCQASAPDAAATCADINDDCVCNNVDDDCNGAVDEDYTATMTVCGAGACQRLGMLTCTGGVEVNSCVPGSPTGDDSSCNNVDDDCDTRVDEAYPTRVTTCGLGVCASTGVDRCIAGQRVNSCIEGPIASTSDDRTVPGNGLDDDCDGKVDEDLPACDTTTRSYEVGSYNLSIPGNCRRVTVRLWGGGGGGGQNAGVSGRGGEGGPGGYSQATVLVASSMQLMVGGGGSNNCNTAGTNPGSSSYSGGSGGTGDGANGADGKVSGGGTGGVPSNGARGGNGFYGGGGAGQGNGLLGASGNGGGGGAATAFVVNGTVAAVAGGGGGGGGAAALSVLGTLAVSGGKGGSGCRGNGQTPSAEGGGGGGGGTCVGGTTQAGSGTSPASAGSIPSRRATGGGSSCGGGGGGYAIVTFSAS